MATRIRTYRELSQLQTFEDRYDYLRIGGRVAEATFGFERYLNQRFYSSREWKNSRNIVIARDLGNDLGIQDREIHDRIIIHHMNPMTPDDIVRAGIDILDPEFLITTRHDTHNAIHYGDRSLLPQEYIPRQRGDTDLWPRIRR